MLLVRFELNETVSAGANYALVNADEVGAGGGLLAERMARLVGGGGIAAEVTVNNGPSARIAEGEVIEGGTPAAAGACYCPENGADGIDWGAAAACGSPCPGGGRAGRFVVVEAQREYRPLLFGWGLADGGAITVRAVVRTE